MVDTARLLGSDTAYRITDLRVTEEGSHIEVVWDSQPEGYQHPGLDNADCGRAARHGEERHISRYPSSFLAAHAYYALTSDGERLPPLPSLHIDPALDTSTRVHWRAEHFGVQHPSKAHGQPTVFPERDVLPRVALHQLLDSAHHCSACPPDAAYSRKRVLAAMRMLRDYGFVLIEGVPPTMEGTEAACRAIGPPMPTLYSRTGMWRTEVRPADPSSESSDSGFNDTAFSTLALPAHTDGCYWGDQPGLQAFHCLKADECGGHSLLVDGFAVAAALRREHPDTFEFFTKTPLRFHHTEPHTHVSAMRPVIQLDASGQVTGFSWNNDDRAPVGRSIGMGGPAVSAFYRHLPVLLRALRDPAFELWLPLRPGTVLVFDNTRVLHGRSAFTAASGRVLAGCYVARQDWHGRMRALAAAEPGAYAPAL